KGSQNVRARASDPTSRVHCEVDHPLVPPSGERRPKARDPRTSVDAAINKFSVYLKQRVVDCLACFDSLNLEQVIPIPLVEAELEKRPKLRGPKVGKFCSSFIKQLPEIYPKQGNADRKGHQHVLNWFDVMNGCLFAALVDLDDHRLEPAL